MNRPSRGAWRLGLLAATLVLAACAAPLRPDEAALRDPVWPRATLLLVGEQHDAAEHQQLQRRIVERLAAQGRLAALALEMAERGATTEGLSRDADESEVRTALRWDAAGWPWPAYGPVVMAAVRAGVPVVGANLPRAAMRTAMRDEGLEAQLDARLVAMLRADVRDGHCGLLPESQIPGMARIQIARDRAMAETLTQIAAAAPAGRVVMLVAGQNHVDARRGVPRHLEATLTRQTLQLAAGAASAAPGPGFDASWPTPPVPPVDHCAGLAGKLGPAR